MDQGNIAKNKALNIVPPKNGKEGFLSFTNSLGSVINTKIQFLAPAVSHLTNFIATKSGYLSSKPAVGGGIGAGASFGAGASLGGGAGVSASASASGGGGGSNGFGSLIGAFLGGSSGGGQSNIDDDRK